MPIVLIVEDDPLLRMLAAEVVEEACFVALEARNAGEAIALREARLDITLLFTDIDMPGSMDGLKLAHVVRDRWPSVNILVVSTFDRGQPIYRRIVALSESPIGRRQSWRHYIPWSVPSDRSRIIRVWADSNVSSFAQTCR